MDGLEWEINYDNYEFPKKNIIDLDRVINLDTPKLNRNNNIDTDMLTYDFANINISDNVNGENTDCTKQQDSKPIPK